MIAGADNPVTEHELGKLKWRCRRGLLENDLLIERFFQRFGATLTHRQATALGLLMELGDNDLLDLNLARKPIAHIDANLDRDDVREVLNMLRHPL